MPPTYRVNEWTLLENLFPFSAIGFTLYYEIKRSIRRNINYNEKEELLNLVEKKFFFKNGKVDNILFWFSFNFIYTQISNRIISKRIKHEAILSYLE